MISNGIRLGTSLGAIALLHAFPLCADPPGFSVRSVEMKCDKTAAPLFGDLDGDGTDDLLLWDGRTLRFFPLGDSGAARGPGQTDLPEEARLFDVGDLDGDGRDEVVCLCPDGVRSFHLEGGRRSEPTRIVDADLRLPGDAVGPGTLIGDADGDGRDDLWFVDGGEIRIYVQTSTGELIPGGTLPIPAPEPGIQPDGMPFEIVLKDADGDGTDDLLCLTPDAVAVFRGTGQGFDGTSGWTLLLASYLEEDDARRIADEQLDDVTLFEDVTGDGRTDFLLSSWSRGRVYLFAGAESIFEALPRQVLDVGPVVTGISAVGDGDGRPSLVVHRYELPGAAGALVRMIAHRKITVKFCFLLFEPADGSELPYPDHPSRVREIPVQIRKGDEKSVEPRLIVAGEDFNGDGWDDVANLGESSSVQFYWGRSEGEFGRRGIPPMFSRETPDPMSLAEFSRWTYELIVTHFHLGSPDLVIPIPSPKGFVVPRRWTPDLNHDGRADLVLPFYPADGSESQKFVVLLSRG